MEKKIDNIGVEFYENKKEDLLKLLNEGLIQHLQLTIPSLTSFQIALDLSKKISTYYPFQSSQYVQ